MTSYRLTLRGGLLGGIVYAVTEAEALRVVTTAMRADVVAVRCPGCGQQRKEWSIALDTGKPGVCLACLSAAIDREGNE